MKALSRSSGKSEGVSKGVVFTIYVLGFALILPSLIRSLFPWRHFHAPLTAAELRIACRSYRAMYGSFPTGSVAEISQSLLGRNAREIVFIKVAPRFIDADGAVCDDWGTPFQLEFSGDTNVVVRSAGPDRQWNTKDDFVR